MVSSPYSYMPSLYHKNLSISSHFFFFWSFAQKHDFDFIYIPRFPFFYKIPQKPKKIAPTPYYGEWADFHRPINDIDSITELCRLQLEGTTSESGGIQMVTIPIDNNSLGNFDGVILGPYFGSQSSIGCEHNTIARLQELRSIFIQIPQHPTTARQHSSGHTLCRYVYTELHQEPRSRNHGRKDCL